MNSLELLKVLIDKLETYESLSGDKESLSLAGFKATLQLDIDLEDLKNTFIEKKEKIDHISVSENDIERVIAQQVLFLYRYIKFYSKIAFAHTTIKSIEEFGFLATLMQFQSLSKTELIKKNVIEKSSGIEIINRLIKAGYCTQFDNPNDLRSQLVALTDAGKAQLYQAFQKMNTLGHIASGTLNQAEKEQLAVILKKLDTFHYDNYYHKNIDKLEDYLPDVAKD